MTWNMIAEHLWMVLVATILTAVVGLPLGVVSYLFPRARKVILWTADILQTIPSLALLGVIMVLLGPGKMTVIVGLLLYSLLPVVRNTCLGLGEIDPAIKEAARGMGMTRFYALIHVELPLAFPMIFTGLRIATVTSVGVAVFANFVGGGGLGALIYRGIHIQSMSMILQGTLTLMVIAIVFDYGMAAIEKRLYHKNRRQSSPPPTLKTT